MSKIKFIFALHNHQPVGNFDSVFEYAYTKTYKPFLELVKKYPGISLSLHYSGSLLEWFVMNKPEFIANLKSMTNSQDIELLSGAFYEPMLTLLPESDRIGQIKYQNSFLRDVIGYTPSGMWIPERVWSLDLPYSICESGLKYCMIDEHHVSRECPVKGYYNTELEGRTTGVFAISEKLRKMIPYESPQTVVDYLLSQRSENEQDVLVFMENGEKFGIYPDSSGSLEWLESFFELLSKNSDKIETVTFSDYWNNYMPLGLTYPTEGGYIEMDEWAKSLRGFGIGWRSFLTKYPEANWMHKRMSQISRRIDTLTSTTRGNEFIRTLRKQFWKGTCHDAYWHGVHGGIYLPHLRNAVWENLIETEKQIDKRLFNLKNQIYREEMDINRDGFRDVAIITKNLHAVFDSRIMGGLAELDYKPSGVNLCNTVGMYPELFHEDMDEKPVYDEFPRYSLFERYLDKDISVEEMRDHDYEDASDFLNEAVDIHTTEQSGKVTFSRNGWISWQRAYVSKTISFNDSGFDVTYTIKNNGICPIDFKFGPEFNLAVNRGEWQQRYYSKPDVIKNENFEIVRDMDAERHLQIVNEADNYKIDVKSEDEMRMMVYPHILPVMSPAGVENVFQSLVLNIFWSLKILPRSEKTVTLSFNLSTNK